MTASGNSSFAPIPNIGWLSCATICVCLHEVLTLFLLDSEKSGSYRYRKPMKMNRLTNEKLKSLYRKAEFDQQHLEVKEIEKTIRSFVNDIAEYIGRRDPLFKNLIVIPSGSFYEDLKVEGPDEFDFMICLADLSQPGVCEKKDIPLRQVRDPGYVHVQVVDEAYRRRWQRYISRRGTDLRPDLLLKRFLGLIKKAVRKKKLVPRQGKIADKIDIELRKIPVTIKLIWNGKKYCNYEISIDLTLCIKMAGWPSASDIRERVKRGHPGYKAFRKAIGEGYHLVASTIDESGKPQPCWRLSFSVAEGIVLKSICKDPRLIHKMVLKVLKVLRKKNEDDLCLLERAVDPGEDFTLTSMSYVITWVFHSYVLKTMFLHEWTDNPEDSHWNKDRLQKRVKAILQRILKSVIKKDIRSFWVPKYKLFNFRARNATDIENCVYKLSDLVEKLRL